MWIKATASHVFNTENQLRNLDSLMSLSLDDCWTFTLVQMELQLLCQNFFPFKNRNSGLKQKKSASYMSRRVAFEPDEKRSFQSSTVSLKTYFDSFL